MPKQGHVPAVPGGIHANLEAPTAALKNAGEQQLSACEPLLSIASTTEGKKKATARWPFVN